MWRNAQKIVYLIDNYAASLITFDKIKLAMSVTWMWAWAGLYVTKAFEAFFTSILKMPDRWLAFPVGDVVNSSGQRVKILSAKSGKTDITNKLKLFMKLYWEKGGVNDANGTNGFDFSKLAKMLNVSMMYCCYLLTDANGDIQPEQFWNSVHTFLIDQTASGDCYRSTVNNLVDRSKLWLRNVDFEGNASTASIAKNRTMQTGQKNIKTEESPEDSLEDLDDELDAYIRAGTALEVEHKSKPMPMADIENILKRKV